MLLLCSIDGCRPDGIEQAHTPTLDLLRASSAWTHKARTVLPACTLPCHTTMHRAVAVERHGITNNTFHPLARPVPSLFDAAHAAGLRTGFFLNWGELRDLAEPGSLDVHFCVNTAHEPNSDGEVTDAFLQAMERGLDLAFLYLGSTDSAGHDHGWMSRPYLAAIEEADCQLARALAALPADSHVIVLADHGGHDRSHGLDIPEDMTIPFYALGPGIRPGEIAEEVNIIQTAPTAALLLGLKAPREWEGSPVSIVEPGWSR